MTSNPSKQRNSWDTRLSRRRALAAGGLAAGLAATRLGSAQEATPDASSNDAERIFTMFVQTAQGGHFFPTPDGDGVYQLVLRGAPARNVYFSDRPQRMVGSLSTARKSVMERLPTTTRPTPPS
jgi:hypothetical protein